MEAQAWEDSFSLDPVFNPRGSAGEEGIKTDQSADKGGLPVREVDS